MVAGGTSKANARRMPRAEDLAPARTAGYLSAQFGPEANKDRAARSFEAEHVLVALVEQVLETNVQT